MRGNGLVASRRAGTSPSAHEVKGRVTWFKGSPSRCRTRGSIASSVKSSRSGAPAWFACPCRTPILRRCAESKSFWMAGWLERYPKRLGKHVFTSVIEILADASFCCSSVARACSPGVSGKHVASWLCMRGPRRDGLALASSSEILSTPTIGDNELWKVHPHSCFYCYRDAWSGHG